MPTNEFVAARTGESEQQWRQFLAYLFQQAATGRAVTGAILGLAVQQTATASGSVNVTIGAGVIQDSTSVGVFPVVNPDNPLVLDVLTANPLGGLPRNDIVVFDYATNSIRAIIGTPNAIPTDPSVPATALALARLRHAASATTIPTAKIDDLRVFTVLNVASPGTDTGWLDLPIVPGGWTVPSGQVRWQARYRGGQVLYRGSLINASFTGLATICTLPAGIPAPSVATAALTVSSNTSNTRAVWVQTDGTVQAYSSGGSTAWFIIGGGYRTD